MRRPYVPGQGRKWSDVYPDASWRIPLNRALEAIQRRTDTTIDSTERITKQVERAELSIAEKQRADREERLKRWRR